jgi:glycosyltransferase involved in cell wall biosynthesis
MLDGIWNRPAARRLRSVLEGLDPQASIVHAHLYSSSLSASVMHESLAAGFPTVLTLHDYFITCPNGAYFVFPRSEICERRALGGSCLACNCDSRRRAHKVWRVVRTWVQNRVARIPQRLTAYAAVSRACAALARRDLPAAARIEVIPNIVSVTRAPPVDVARNHAFVFTGRLESYKGPQLLARAATRLGVPAVFCGTGPMERELRRINPTARFTGWIGPGQILDELGAARAFVFPSVYRETFGLSAAEALARGIPVVASRGTAAEEFVFHGENGLLFNHNSADDLANQLEALVDDRLVARLGEEAYRRYWSEPLTEEAHVSRLEAFYRTALGSGPAPGTAHVHSAPPRAGVLT